MTICRSLAEVRDAAAADHDGPLTQDQADLVAAILWPHRDLLERHAAQLGDSREAGGAQR